MAIEFYSIVLSSKRIFKYEMILPHQDKLEVSWHCINNPMCICFLTAYDHFSKLSAVSFNIWFHTKL